MTEKLRELFERKNKLIKDMRGILDKANKEKRSVTDEENATYDTMDADLDKVLDDIKEEERSEERAKKLAMLEGASYNPDQALGNQDEDINKRKLPPPEEIRAKLAKGWEVREDVVLGGARSTRPYETCFRNFLNRGYGGLTTEDRAILDTAVEELRALQADVDIQGGYMVAPEQFVAKLIMAKDNIVFVRRYGTVIPLTSAASVGFPELDNDPSDPDWTAKTLAHCVAIRNANPVNSVEALHG